MILKKSQAPIQKNRLLKMSRTHPTEEFAQIAQILGFLDAQDAKVHGIAANLVKKFTGQVINTVARRPNHRFRWYYLKQIYINISIFINTLHISFFHSIPLLF